MPKNIRLHTFPDPFGLLGPLASILDFAGSLTLQAVSEWGLSHLPFFKNRCQGYFYQEPPALVGWHPASLFQRVAEFHHSLREVKNETFQLRTKKTKGKGYMGRILTIMKETTRNY